MLDAANTMGACVAKSMGVYAVCAYDGPEEARLTHPKGLASMLRVGRVNTSFHSGRALARPSEAGLGKEKEASR